MYISPEIQAVLIGLAVAAGMYGQRLFDSWGKRIQAGADHRVATTQAESTKAIAAAEIETQMERLKVQALETALSSERHLRSLIDELNTDAALKDERIAALTVQQERNVVTIKELQDKAETRHKEMNEAAAREAALNSTILDLQNDMVKLRKQLADCIAGLPVKPDTP